MTKDKNVKMEKTDEYYELVGLVAAKFFGDWQKAYNAKQKEWSVRDRERLFEYMPAFFRRWYFSAVIEESLLSPANLIKALNEEYGVSDGMAPVLKIGVNDKGERAPIVAIVDFGAETHPLFEDLKIFLEGVSPAFEAAVLRGKWMDNLSFGDPEYLEFLCEVALELRLVKKMPSIGAEINMVNENYMNFFDAPTEVILNRISEAVCGICLSEMSEVLPLNKGFKKTLKEYLKTPKSVDEVFGDMFKDADLDLFDLMSDIGGNMDMLESILGEAGDDDGGIGFDSFQASLVTSTFFLGVSLDKWFLTPMAHYLRLIHPLYILPINMSEEMENFVDYIQQEDEPGTAVYAPCSVFDLTELGGKVCGGVRGEAEIFLPKNLSASQIARSFNSLVYVKNETNGASSGFVATLKVVPEDGAGGWVNIEFSTSATLEEAHEFICGYFKLDKGADYSFYADCVESPFYEYGRKGGAGRVTGKNPSKVTLEDFGIEAGTEMLYKISCPPPKGKKRRVQRRYSVKVMKVAEKRDKQYPRVSRRGRTED